MLYIYLLGHLRLFEDDHPVHFRGLPKTLPLWACLLLNRTGPMPRSTLAYILWPDVPESVARSNLRRHLYDLKQALPPASPGRPWLLIEAGTVQWNPQADFWLDVAEFERLSALPEHLARAIALYDGDLLPEVYDDCIRIERERLRSLYLEDLSRLVAQCRDRGDLGQAIRYAGQLLRQDPLQEDTVCELMRLRYQAGDRPGALQVYQDFRRRLQEELGLSSMPETRALYEGVLQGLPLPEAAPPLAPVSCPHNLPAQVNRFFGRERDLLALSELLFPGKSPVRLVTLVGPPGVGKTRLALEAAARLLPQQARTFPDGIFFVDLAPLATPELVLPTIAQVLKVKERGGRPLLATLKDILRHKHMLLLLDNFEHVLRATTQVGELLAAAPNLRVLATSRTPLRLYGEQEYPVEPLPLPDPNAPLEGSEEGNAALALLVDRARARRPDFCLSVEERAAAAEICLRLGGLPLAIELAAGHLKAHSPTEVLERLKPMLPLLGAAPRDWPARHRTLRRAIDWSYDLLGEREQTLFALLSLFAGGCTLAAAEAVCASLCAGDVARGLATLVEHSLIQRVIQEGEVRFTMLAPLREYALERLERSGRREEAGRRYLAYYAEMGGAARREWSGPQQGFWLKQLNTEVDNLRAALGWALEGTADAARVQTGAKLAEDTMQFWEASGRITEGRAWVERALSYRSCLSVERQVHLLNSAGWFAQIQGEYSIAEKCYEEGIALARREEDPALVSMGLHSLATMAGRRGDYRRARSLLEEAIAVEQEASGGAMTTQLSRMLNNLAIVCKHLGEYERAEALLEESLAFKRAQGDLLGVAASLVNLGNLALAREDYAGAEEYFRESLRLRQSLGDRKGILTLLPSLAEAAALRGQAVRSVRLYAANQALRQDMGYPMTAAQQEDADRRIAALREELGTAHFAAAWAGGETMTLEQVVAYALGTL